MPNPILCRGICYIARMRRTIPALLLLATVPAFAANYATCLLDALPGTQNDVAAHAAMQVCQSKHPGGLEAVQQGSGRGIFGYNSGAECTAKKAGDTRSQRAAYIIGAACRRLYDEPVRYLTDEEVGFPPARR